MFSFRKIVNVLVLVAYVKMTLVSSFAVDVGSLPPGKVQYKLKVDRQLNEAGALEYIQLSLQHKDLQTGEKKTLRCDRIDDPETVPAEDIDWTTENKRETGYKWRYIKKFGQVRVGLDGQIFLQNINQLDTNVIFKVKGPHLITLRNCQISHLHTQALSTIFIGATNIDTLHAKATQEQGGVYLYAHKSTPSAQVQIKNMHLKGDNFVNHSHLIATGKGTWDLGGGDFINSGTLTSQGAPQTITSVRLFDNVGQIGGESISLQTQKHVNESQGEINLNKYAVTAQELFINDGKIHTLQQGLYKWKGEAINGGQIISDNSYAFSSLEEASSPILINNGVMRAQQGEFRYIKLANYGEMDQQKSVLTRIALVNSGQCKLGWMDQKSDCRITELVNRGQMSGTGFLSIDKGQNYGELNLSGLRLTLGAGGELINTAQVWLSTLLGEGKFINRGTFHTAQTKGITALYIHSFDNRGGKIVGKQLQLKETLEAFICDADSSLDLASLIIYSAASPQTSLLHLAGTIQCSQGLKIYERKVSVDGSIITPHFWSEGGEISFTANGRLQTPATKLINSKLLNQGTVDLGKVSFTNAQLVNSNALTFESTIKVNSARFENVGHLWIKKLLEVKEGDLNAANLGQFTVGVDNQNLGQVNADNGAVNIEAEGTVDLRYGSVQSTKQTLLKSLTKDVMLGARLGVMTEQSYKPTGKRLNNPFYEKSHLNGTCVSAADHLRIEAPLGNILLEYGQLQAGRGLMLIARDRIYNLSGALSVIGDLVLQAKTYHQTRIDLRAFQGTSSNPNYQHLCYYLEQADPSTINVIGNLYSETETFTNEYGSVLISQNFYHHNALQDVENLPQSIKNISRATLYDVKEVGTGRWYTEKGATPPSIAKLKVGEKIHIKIGSAEMSGSMSAPIINLYAQAAAFSNPVASRSPSQTTERVTVNLNEFIEDIRQDPSHHLLRIGASGAPSLDSTLVQGEKPEGTIINPLTDVNVEFYLYQLFSEITGRAYLKQGNTITSGFALVEQLKNTHTYSSKKCTTYEYDLVNYGNRFSTGKHVNSVWAAKLPSEQQGQNHMITKVGGHTFIRGGTQLIDGESPRETAGSTLIVPAIDIHQRIEQKSKKRKFLGRLVPFREGRKKKTVRNESGYTQLQRHRQDARGLIREKAKADVSLHAVDYTAGANIEVESETGQIKVPAVISESWNQTQKRSKDDHWQSRSSTWEHDQEANVSRFSPGTGSKVILKAPKGIVAPRVQEEHKHVKGENERTEVYSKKFTGPGYEWLEELKLRDDVIWEDVIEKHHSGRVAAQGMTTAAKIAAVIVITILTWGTGTPAVTGAGTASGAAAGGAAAGAAAGGAAAGASAGAATVGAASVTATTAGAAAGAGAAASSFTVAANAAMSAAFEAIKTATIQHFAIGAVGQRGRMDRVIESYATPQNFRSMAVDAISAGLTQGMSQYFKIETTQMNGFMEQVKGNGLKFAANFAAQTAVHGKADEALKNAAISFGVDTVFGSMTNDTGERRSGQIGVNDTFMQKVLHKVEHFLIGGLREGTSAALHGKKGHELSEAALGGAIGAATAESQLEAEGLTPDSQAYKERYSILKDQQMEKIKAYGQLAAVGAANTLGLNVEAAQSAALKAMENNTGRVFGAFSIISDTAIDDFSQQEDQAKAADETCVRSEAELEAILDQWDDLREENQLLQKGQYRPGTGDTASTAEDVSGLFFDAATRDQRIANIKARNVMSDKTRQLLVEHYTAHTTFQQLAQQPYLMVKPTERRFDIIERAKQALASHTAPDLAQVSGYAASSSSSTGPSVMMASLAATATTAGHIMQGPMPRFAAATAGGAPAMFELAAAGFGKVPLNPSTALRVAVALGLTYGAYKGYEWYQDREQARESQAAAEREDFKQAYESSRSQQGQAWLQRHTYNLAAADTAIPGVYNPSTDKGKERVSGSSTSHCETTDPVQGWVDAGFTTEPAKVQILSTPMPEPARPDIEGFDPASLGIDTTLPGFEIYDGPQIQILTRDQKHSIKSRLKEAQLPTQGKIRFIPPKEYNPSTTLKRGNNYGYLDRFGNEWTKGPSRTQGQEFEWDVQLSRQGKNKIGWASRDGSHVNVSLDGEITHK
ncbi:polymorphic toxin type 17 domain-containing protein [Candidatus Odyssella thessalonicensis]|uniref:polymorphic toxin type 17 domain-containing protein n=1 Tax=Candidatus Odyssella thessalonicensis TaxID=84647 RepID=UPI000225B774|nr:polymorphic toxin type 17 domain-containing protein [Candidatus Odyssella thessalonicensis]